MQKRKIPFDERIRLVDDTVKEVKDFWDMPIPSFFSGVSHLLNQKYPEWILTKLEEKSEKFREMKMMSLIYYGGDWALEEKAEEAYETLYQSLIEPFYFMYEKEQEEKELC